MKTVTFGYGQDYNAQPDPLSLLGQETKPTLGETTRAIFSRENDIMAMADILSRPTFAPDPEFDVLTVGRQSPLWQSNWKQLGRATSQGEFDFISQKILQEQAHMRTISSAPAALKVPLIITAALASPTTFIPLTAPYKGVKGATSAFALAGTAAGAQEAILFENQETRTMREVIEGTTYGTLLGGMLGSAAVYFKGTDDVAAFARVERDMKGEPTEVVLTVPKEGGGTEELFMPLMDLDLHYNMMLPRPLTKVVGPQGTLMGSTTHFSVPTKFPVDTRGLEDAARIHSTVRQFNPELFNNYDALLTRQATYRKWVEEIREKGTLDVKQTLRQMDARLSGLEDLRKTVQGKGPKAQLRKQIMETKADKAALQKAAVGPYEADMRLLREELVKLDEQLRDLAPSIGKVYSKARAEKVVPDAEADRAWKAYTEGRVKDGNELSTAFYGVRGGDQIPEVRRATQKRKVRSEEQAVQTARHSVDEPFDGSARDLSAADSAVNVKGLSAPNRFVGKIVNTMARMNPLHRRITDESSQASRNWAAKFSLGGLHVETDTAFGAAAEGGTIWARRDNHMGEIAKATLRVRESYANYLYGEGAGDSIVRRDFISQIASGARQLPKGKQTWKEFSHDVYEAGSRGEVPSDPYKAQAVAAWKEFSDYFNKVMDKAWEERRLLDPTAKRLVPEEANLGPGVQDYVTQLYDPQKMSELSAEFLEDVTKYYDGLLHRNFQKSLQRHEKRRKKLNFMADMQEMPEGQYAAWVKTTDEHIAAIEADPEFARVNKLVEDRRAALKESGLTGKDLSEDLEAFRQSLGELYLSQRQQLGELKQAKATAKKVRTESSEKLGATREQLTAAEAEEAELRGLFHELESEDYFSRQDALWKRIDELEENLARQGDFRTRVRKLDEDWEQGWRERGATGGDFRRELPDFAERARENAHKLHNSIQGNKFHIAGLAVLGGERGPELSRGLNLPFEQKVKYLTTDLEEVIRIYGRHMSADVEMYRATGNVNGARVFADLEIEHQRLVDQMLAAPKMTKAEVNAKLRELREAGELTPEKAYYYNEVVPSTEADRSRRISAETAAYGKRVGDFHVLVERTRHQRGIPDDADSFMHRAGNVAKHLNVGRFMGNVMPASFPDVGRPIMTHGLVNTFGKGWSTMFGGMKELGRAADAEIYRAGIGFDPVMHNRTAALFDTLETYQGATTKAERAVATAANKMGLIAGFDWWTKNMKMIAGRVSLGVISDNLETVMSGVKGKRYDKAVRNLTRLGINEEMSNRMWKQYLKSGEEFKGGYRLPNTEGWDDLEAVSTLRAALLQDVDDMIVTPGLDRPSWMDANLGYQLLAQFRSFTYTSMNRTVLRGLQDADMAVLNGSLVSLALGAVSYYTWAMSIGGTQRENMLNATPEQWAYEAISRSGLLGVFAEAQRIGETIPGLQEYWAFGGHSTRTRRAENTLGAILGPTYDLGTRMARTVQGLDSPTQSTLHQARLMMPYQNVFYLRQLLTQVEEGLGDAVGLPERRQ